MLHLPLQYWMFVCAASIIYKVAFILISAGTPTVENHDVFCIYSFNRYWCFAGQQRKIGNHFIWFSLHFYKHSDMHLQFCIIFNTCKHLCVSGKQKCTMAVWYNVYITKNLLSVLTEVRRGVPGKHWLPNPYFFSFLIFPLKSNPSRKIVERYSILI